MKKRTTKAERKVNAKQFYQCLEQSKRAVVVYEYIDSSNPNTNHVRFWATATLFKSIPVVIAEGYTLGKEECFFELFESISPHYPMKTMYEDGFKEWVEKQYGIKIIYDDGMAMIFEM